MTVSCIFLYDAELWLYVRFLPTILASHLTQKLVRLHCPSRASSDKSIMSSYIHLTVLKILQETEF